MAGWHSPSSPRGVGILADLEILVGIVYIFLGFYLIFNFATSGLGVASSGLILIYMGWSLSKLEIWAWWGSLLLNCAIFIGNIIFSGEFLPIILSLVIIIYLITPGVRSRFLQ